MSNFQISFRLLFLMLILIIWGCARNKMESHINDLGPTQRVYIESIACDDRTPHSNNLRVTVTGNMPSPAYSFDRFEVSVQGNIIEIIPTAVFDQNVMAAQMLVPFEKVCEIKDLSAGMYHIRVIGRGDTVVERRDVEITAE